MAVKTPPCQEWSIREKLCLASAVMRSGDQNWVSVSRAIKPFPEPGRPSDWNTPKHCAIQYSAMLSEVDTPKRKRSGDRAGDIVETPGDLIVKKMTFDRVEELKQMLADDRRKFKLLREEIELIESGALDEKLPEILADIREKKRQAEEQKLAEEKLAAERQAKKEEQKKQSPVRRAARLSEMDQKAAEAAPSTEKKPTETADQAKLSPLKPAAVVTDAASSGPKSTTPGPKPPTPVLLPKLLVSEMKEEKKEPISREQISDIKAMLSKPDEEKTRTPQAETHPPAAEKEVPKTQQKETPTLSKLLLTSGTYTSPTSKAPTPAVEPETTAATTKATPSAKVPTVVEPESSEEVQVSVVEESAPAPHTAPTPQLQVPNVDEESSDVSMAASTEPSSPSAPRIEETKKRRRGRPKKKERDVGESTDQARPASESADETKDGARSETAESEGTERPSESDRDSLSNVQVTGSVFGESLPNSPASLSQLDDLQDHPSKQWKKAIMLVWREAASHKYANLFLHPVTDDIAPGYSNTVYRRMDLSTIKRNIENGTIRTVEAFQRDMMLMFQNAIMYNRSDHDVYRMACHMQTDVLKSIEEFISTQMLVRNPEASKSLRGRRNVDASQKDEVDHSSGKTKRKTRGDE